MAKQTFTTGQVLTSAEMTALQLNDYNQTVSAKTANYVLVAADAGTRITMSNAGATTITVNTSLFTAGDTLFITNIGAGASTITAGTATVSTASSLVLAQYDSGCLYFTSAGVAIWEKYDGAAAAGATFHGCSVYSQAAINVTASVYFQILYANEGYDTDGYHSTSSNTSRITIPAGLAGKYLVIGTTCSQTTNNGTGRIQVKVNGSAITTQYGAGQIIGTIAYGQGGAASSNELTGSVVLNLAVGDYIELYGTIDSTNASNVVWSAFQASYLGA